MDCRFGIHEGAVAAPAAGAFEEFIDAAAEFGLELERAVETDRANGGVGRSAG